MKSIIEPLTSSCKPFLFGALLVGFLGCSEAPVVKDFPDTADPLTETQNLETDLRTAAGNQVSVLAPVRFHKAEDSLNDAKKALEKKKDHREILHEVAIGRSYLDQANQAAAASRGQMEEVVKARADAIAASAPSLITADFNDADDEFRSVTSDVEEGDLSSVRKQRAKLQAQYLDLELRAIKIAYLRPAQQIIEQAKKEGAQDFAPRLLAVAQKSVEDTEAFITGSRHDAEEIKKRSTQTHQNSEHVLNITRLAKTTHKTPPEEVALQIESGNKLIENERNALNNVKSSARSLSEKNRALLSKQEFNRLYEEARSKFKDDEAEVYRQGDTLLIRLKGLQFPKGQATLRGRSFALLSKVDEVVDEFGASHVKVEGHTDSTGGRELNQKLSTERAEAVKKYLVSKDLDEAQVEAVGQSFEKPLASNKTAEGRAKNRRVDIYIEPQTENTPYQREQRDSIDLTNQ